MSSAQSTQDLLRAIDGKLGALLAFAVRDRIDEARRAERPLDVVLHEAGLGTAEIAEMLGKSQRAVQLAIKGK
jgi:hypothetical protein